MPYFSSARIRNTQSNIILLCAGLYLSGCSSTPEISINQTEVTDKSAEYLSIRNKSEEYIGFDIENGQIKNSEIMDGPTESIQKSANEMHLKNASQKTIFRDCIIIRSNEYTPCSNTLGHNAFSIFQDKEYDGNLISSTLALGLSPIPLALDSLSTLGGDTSFDATKDYLDSETKLVINKKKVDDVGRSLVVRQLEAIESEAKKLENSNDTSRVAAFTSSYPGYPNNALIVRHLMSNKFAENDISGVMTVLNNIPQHASKDDVVSWLRTQNTFEGYKAAFGITESIEDAKAANQLAKSSAERVELEHMALVLMKENKTKAFSLTSNHLDQSTTSHSEGYGFFLQGKDIASNEFSIKLRAINNKDIINLADGNYTVKVKVKLMIPVHFRRASNWVGNEDKYKTDDYIQEINIPYTRNMDRNKLYDVTFKNIRTAYKDRGIMGGTTEVQMVGAPKIEAEVIDVTY